MKDDPGPSQRDDLRARTLLRLLPVHVHALKNALMVVQGTLELGPRPAQSLAAHAKLTALDECLSRLAFLAREPSETPEVVALHDVFHDLEILLGPFARSGVRLLLGDPGALMVRMDESFRSLLAGLCVALLATERGQRRLLRLRLECGADRATLVVRAIGCRPVPEELAALRAHVLAQRGVLQARVARGRLALRISLAPEGGVPPSMAGPVHAAARRVLLLHREAEERELACAVLSEKGFVVHSAPEPPSRGGFDQAVVEVRLLELDPGLAGRLTARFGLARVLPLEPRMRPEALLALLKGRG